ncbi:MAG: PAS domain-containing protein, partial [Campylobacterales bacterium]|nr:PAS domain-containing protein [Campylobacterales bacterium]
MKLSIKMFNIIIYSLTVVFVSIAAITDASDDLLLSQASIFVLFLLFFMFIQHTLLRPINSMIDFATGKRNTIDKSIFSEVNLLGENVEKALSGLSAKNKRANELLQKFFNNMHDGVLIHDMQGHIIDANDTAIKMFGASEKNEMLRLTIPEISTDNNPISRLGDIWQNVLIGKEMKFEWEGKRLDDKSFWIEVYLTKVEYEEDTYILANLIDITEAKKQRVLIELIMDLQENIVFLASNEKIVIANNSFMNYFSFDSLESTNEHFHCIKGLFLDYELECEQPLCKFGRTMKKEANKLICVRQDGQREIFLIAVNTLFVDEELYIVSLTDITSMELEKEILELKSNI